MINTLGDKRHIGYEGIMGYLGVIEIVIPGTPIGKPRMTQRDKWATRDCVMRYRSWADKVRAMAGVLPATELIDRLDWVAYFEPPKSWSAKKQAAALGSLHRSKPDRDNIDKAVLDALFKSDSSIARGTIEKLWGEPSRLEIRICVVPVRGPHHELQRDASHGSEE